MWHTQSYIKLHVVTPVLFAAMASHHRCAQLHFHEVAVASGTLNHTLSYLSLCMSTSTYWVWHLLLVAQATPFSAFCWTRCQEMTTHTLPMSFCNLTLLNMGLSLTPITLLTDTLLFCFPSTGYTGDNGNMLCHNSLQQLKHTVMKWQLIVRHNYVRSITASKSRFSTNNQLLNSTIF